MGLGKDKLEQNYLRFGRQEAIEQKKDDIEYLGVNLSSDRNEIVFKVYYKDNYSRQELHPIVERLEAKNMIRTLTQIIDTKNGTCKRYDIGLGQRTNDRMEQLLKDIEEMAPFCAAYRDEIRTMTQMKVCADPEYAFAALYFWGFIEKEDEIDAIKMHYLTRICENPDKLGKRDIFDDAYYLDYLEGMKIPQFAELVPIVRTAVDGRHGILWMSGVDYFRHGNDKYKIYFKTPIDKYVKNLKQALTWSTDESRKLAVLMDSLENWLLQHVELKMDGVAVGLDRKGCWSLNYYFKWTE